MVDRSVLLHLLKEYVPLTISCENREAFGLQTKYRWRVKETLKLKDLKRYFYALKDEGLLTLKIIHNTNHAPYALVFDFSP